MEEQWVDLEGLGGSAKVTLSFFHQPHREGNDYIKELHDELCTNMSES